MTGHRGWGERNRLDAARALSIAASTPGIYVFEAINACVSPSRRADVMDVVADVLCAARDVRLTWAEQRAEAEAMLRTGWTP